MLEEFLKKYNISLTDQQKKAAESVEGPTLLLAVPGSGKTTTLVARLGYMIYEKHIEPENILVLTYTVAATKDMSERFVKVFGDEMKDRLEFRTINGVCAKIILHYSHIINKPAFRLEADEKKRALRISQIYQKIVEDFPTESEIREITTFSTYVKNMMLTEEEIKKQAKDYSYDIVAIYKEYCASMQREGLMDYDDQMRYAYNILKSSPETLAFFQNIYRYICVDEAQDTSKIQHIIIALLASKDNNLFMVGDEDQSIYAWRAAYPDALLTFSSDHPGANVLLMEENFRSNAKIVSAADRFIQKNIYRHKKNMRAYREEGEDIKVKSLPNRVAQYEYLAKKLENVTVETAVLYKNNDSILPLVDKMERMGIDYRIKNAELMFFTHRIVTDILDIMKFALEPSNKELFLKIYYKMNIYLSKKEAYFLCEQAQKQNVSILDAGRRTRILKDFKLTRFIEFSGEMKQIAHAKPHNAISFIANMSGYKKYLEKKHMVDNKSFILREIAKNCNSYNELVARLNFLHNTILANNSSTDINVIFSTIHSSKGLEYDTVYMLDIFEGVIPDEEIDLHATKEERRTYEEERRVYYVGITRAKNRLILLDIKGENCSFIDETVRVYKPSNNKSINFNKHKKPVRDMSSGESFEDFCNRLVVGGEVVHNTFGVGTISNIKVPYIKVEFSDKERMFGLKMVFEQGLLETVKDDEE